MKKKEEKKLEAVIRRCSMKVAFKVIEKFRGKHLYWSLRVYESFLEQLESCSCLNSQISTCGKK